MPYLSLSQLVETERLPPAAEDPMSPPVSAAEETEKTPAAAEESMSPPASAAEEPMSPPVSLKPKPTRAMENAPPSVPAKNASLSVPAAETKDSSLEQLLSLLEDNGEELPIPKRRHIEALVKVFDVEVNLHHKYAIFRRKSSPQEADVDPPQVKAEEKGHINKKCCIRTEERGSSMDTEERGSSMDMGKIEPKSPKTDVPDDEKKPQGNSMDTGTTIEPKSRKTDVPDDEKKSQGNSMDTGTTIEPKDATNKKKFLMKELEGLNNEQSWLMKHCREQGFELNDDDLKDKCYLEIIIQNLEAGSHDAANMPTSHLNEKVNELDKQIESLTQSVQERRNTLSNNRAKYVTDMNQYLHSYLNEHGMDGKIKLKVEEQKLELIIDNKKGLGQTTETMEKSNLSGGETYLAIFAFALATKTCSKSPLLVLDEVDRCLDAAAKHTLWKQLVSRTHLPLCVCTCTHFLTLQTFASFSA
jgi:hypothetical protein